MCPPAIIGAAATAGSFVAANASTIGAALAAGGQGLSGIFAFRRARAQQRALQAQAADQGVLDAYSEQGAMDEANRFLARDRLATLASGLDPSAGSPADAAQRNERAVAMNLIMRRYGASGRRANLQQGAANAGAAATAGLAEGFIGAGAELLSADALWPMFGRGT